MARNTRHRREIIALFEAAPHEHLSARAVLTRLEADGTRVGAATVYRQLDSLVDQGVLRKYDTGARSAACYEIATDPSCSDTCFHCICTSCGKLMHVNCSQLSDVREHLLAHHGFAVDPMRTVFYGRCSDCSAGSS